jgi:hypothetical protein
MLLSRRGPERKRTSLVSDLRGLKAPLVSGQVFYQTKLTRDPIGNERGRLTLHYIIAVQTHDPDGNPYEHHPEDRARETFNLMPGRGIDDPVNLTYIKEEDLPEEKLQQALLRHDGAVYLVKNG